MTIDNIQTRPENKRNLAWLVTGLTVAFALILTPFSGAVWWAVFLAIVFAPVHRSLLTRLPRRPNSTALCTLAVVVVIVILPLSVLGAAIAQEISQFVERIRSGEIVVTEYFQRVLEILPAWLRQLLERFGVGDLGGLQQKLTAGVIESNRAISAHVFTASQLTLDWMLSFVLMLYVLFFLLRDGEALGARLVRAVPLASGHKQVLVTQFVKVVRATVQGNILVALIQGLLGAVAFWVLGISGALLWGALMAVLSLLPAVGAALVWGPVALYLLAVGEIWQGACLVLWGVLVIGLIDNLLRPALVSKSTHMPDYVVLMATVGGIAALGINGFVLGPVIAALFLAAWEIFVRERNAAGPVEDAGTVEDLPMLPVKPAARNSRRARAERAPLPPR